MDINILKDGINRVELLQKSLSRFDKMLKDKEYSTYDWLHTIVNTGPGYDSSLFSECFITPDMMKELVHKMVERLRLSIKREEKALSELMKTQTT